MVDFRKQLLKQIEDQVAVQVYVTLALKPIGAVDDLRKQALQQIRDLTETSSVKASLLAQIEQVRRNHELARSMGFVFPEENFTLRRKRDEC